MKHIIPSDLRYTITLALKKEFQNCHVNQWYNAEQSRSGAVCYQITCRNIKINNREYEIIHYVHYKDGLLSYTGWHCNGFRHRGNGDINKVLLSDPECFTKIKSLVNKSLADYNSQLEQRILKLKKTKFKCFVMVASILSSIALFLIIYTIIFIINL